MPQYGEEGYDYDAIYAALSDQKMQWKGAGGIAQPVPLIRVDPAFRLVLSFGTLEDAGEKPAVTVYDAVIEPDENELFPLAAVYVNSFGTMLDADIEQGGTCGAEAVRPFPGPGDAGPQGLLHPGAEGFLRGTLYPI